MINQQLPRWDLSDLYNGKDDPAIAKDKENITSFCESFVKKYKGNLSGLNGQEFLQAVKDLENLSSLISKLMSYSYLLYITDINNKEKSSFLQLNKEFIHTISVNLTFFDLELNNLGEENLQKWFKEEKGLSFYQGFIDQTRRWKPFQLPEIAEQILIAKTAVSSSAWVRLYDELLAALTFNNPEPKIEKKLSLGEMLNLLLSEEKAKRDKTAEILKEGLEKNQGLIVSVINNIVKDAAITKEFRGFKQPYSGMNLYNMISDDIMENLVAAVKSTYNSISHRYYKLKAKALGLNKLKYWDRNAPLFKPKSSNKISYSEAVTIIKQAYYNFDQQFGDIISLFFKHNWIDVPPLQGKESGAFCHSSVTNNHPYILINFHGEYTDVTTLAHELGHGVHQYLAREMGELQSGTPLILAETASVFGEQLVFDYMKSTATDLNMKKFLLSNKIEGIINTVHRQIAFHLFEERIHKLRATEELSSHSLKEAFYLTQKECLGDSVDLSLNDGIFWSYVSHFFHTPFYVYAYAFGECLVRSLYSLYQNGYPNFKQKYINLLSKGGSVAPKAAIDEFGLDIKSKDFWQNGLNLTARLIDELEELL